MYSRLGTKPRRAGRHLGNAEDVKVRLTHRFRSGPPSTEWEEFLNWNFVDCPLENRLMTLTARDQQFKNLPAINIVS
jgi:hypothetical protein